MARLLLPPGAAVLGYTTESVAQPSKDTGTVLGVIERDPVNYYRQGELPTCCQSCISCWPAAVLAVGCSLPRARA